MSDDSKSNSTTGGILSLGWLVAVVLSWLTNHSVLWCVLHAFCGWFYVAYWLCVNDMWRWWVR